MAISEEDIRKVREASDIVAIMGERSVLRQRGRDFWCCCPFHNEKTPSCKIDPSTQLWHCFGCGEGGDVFGFIMKSEDVSFPDAVRYLADRAHIDIQESGRPSMPSSQKARLKDICRLTDEFYHNQLMRGPSEDAAAARSYLSSRNLGSEVSVKWHLGYAPGHQQLVRFLSSKGYKPEEMIAANVAVSHEGARLSDRFFNRIMFPINNQQGECIAFGGRVVGSGEPKYLNSQETPLFHKSNVLYGLDKAKSAMVSSGTAIVVEGYTDVIALHESGIENVVATLGTALTVQHVRLLSRHASKRIVYLFDGDAAGQRAADRALGFINEDMTPEAGKAQIELCAVTLPDDLDPADFVGKRGGEALKLLVDDAKPLISYGIDRKLAAHDLSSAEGRTRALSSALSVLAPIKNSMLAKDYAVQLAGRLMMREQDVLNALAVLQAPRPIDRVSSDEKAASAFTAAQPPISGAERSRRNFEQRLLSLLAQNPLLALEHADALVSTQWHLATHADLAQCMLSTLERDPSAKPADIVSDAARMHPQSASILTIAEEDGSDSAQVVDYLIDELEIGDMESALSSMNLQLKQAEKGDSEERAIIFQAAVDLQKTIAARRSAHEERVIGL